MHSASPDFEIRPIRPHELEAARQLLLDAGWDRQVATPQEFAQLVAQSSLALAAVRDGLVLGFLRALTDGLTNGYVSMLVVHPQHQRRGIGRALMAAALGTEARMTWVLRAGGRGEASSFYEKLGFSRSTVAMERPARPGPGLPSKLSLLRCPPANDRVSRTETAARAESSAGASTRNTQETGMFTRDTCCTLVPYFEVQDGQLAAFKALGPQFVAKTRTESGCLHYAFSFNGSTAHCREGYANAEALLAHLQNVGELLGQALKIAKIVKLEVHAPAAEIEKLRGPMAALNPQFFTLEEGIRRSNAA